MQKDQKENYVTNWFIRAFDFNAINCEFKNTCKKDNRLTNTGGHYSLIMVRVDTDIIIFKVKCVLAEFHMF